MNAQPRKRLAPIFTWRTAISESELPASMRHCLLALSLYMNEKGGSAFPGAARLAHDTGLHQSTVKAALRGAYKAGWLRLVSMGGAPKGGARVASVYTSAIPADFVARPYDDRGSRTPGLDDTGSSDDEDWVSWTTRPGVQDAPMSSKNSPTNLRAREGRCNEWVEVAARAGEAGPSVAACALMTGHDGPCEAARHLESVNDRKDIA